MRWNQSIACMAALIVIVLINTNQSCGKDSWSMKKLWPNRQGSMRGVKPPTRKSAWTTQAFQATDDNRSDQPSIMQRITSGPRNLWDRTKALVTPNNKKPNNKKRSRFPSTRRRSKSPSIFERLLGQKEPTAGPKTITDFLKQDRPG